MAPRSQTRGAPDPDQVLVYGVVAFVIAMVLLVFYGIFASQKRAVSDLARERLVAKAIRADMKAFAAAWDTDSLTPAARLQKDTWVESWSRCWGKHQVVSDSGRTSSLYLKNNAPMEEALRVVALASRASPDSSVAPEIVKQAVLQAGTSCSDGILDRVALGNPKEALVLAKIVQQVGYPLSATYRTRLQEAASSGAPAH